MTNGEKIKEIFPDGVLTSISNSYYWGDDILVHKSWWNAEYKETTKNDATDINVGKIGSTTKNDLVDDAVRRKAVQTRLKEIINEMETIFADIREREVNDSVCGLCEYDCDHGLDGFANECPGFEKDDCFKLNEKYRAEWLDIRNLPSVTPQEPCEDTISRKSIKQKLQEHHDFFVNAYGGFSNLPQNDKSRVDEITNCIAMVVNEPPVTPQEPRKITLEDVKGYCEPRCLTIISNELLYELTHPKIKALEQESASTQEYGLTDADTDKYAVQVQNGEGYYNSFGRYVSYDLD